MEETLNNILYNTLQNMNRNSKMQAVSDQSLQTWQPQHWHYVNHTPKTTTIAADSVLAIWGNRLITSRKSIASRGPARSINRSPCFLMATDWALRKSKKNNLSNFMNFFNIEKLRSYIWLIFQ